MGFAVLDELVDRVRQATLKSSMDNHVSGALKARGADISRLNTEQLSRGMDTELRGLGVYKNFNYKNRWSPVDLKLTGDFHRSIRPRFGQAEMELTATDPKTDMLQDKYGDDILGLTLEDIWELGEDAKGQIQYNLRREIL